MDQLSGRVAFITGSAGGIGLGIARACAAVGMKIALSDIDQRTLEQSAFELRSRGAEVMTVPLDVTDRDGWARAARDVPAAMGPVQLLANNAGVSTFGVPFKEIGPELWDRVIAINLAGVYNGVHYFLEGMQAAGSGHIVNSSSAAGLGGVPNAGPYSATKYAIIGLSESLRAELAGSGIGVSVLCPGSVRTRLWRTSRAVRGLPDIDAPPAELRGSGSTDPNGMDPDEVGRRVVDAVVADEPYIMTHPELRDFVTERHQALLRGFELAAESGAELAAGQHHEEPSAARTRDYGQR
jgi:NAD(P)-dependent dehydrogenase (short-subunit alcohol dehydrogenase family)